MFLESILLLLFCLVKSAYLTSYATRNSNLYTYLPLIVYLAVTKTYLSNKYLVIRYIFICLNWCIYGLWWLLFPLITFIACIFSGFTVLFFFSMRIYVYVLKFILRPEVIQIYSFCDGYGYVSSWTDLV